MIEPVLSVYCMYVCGSIGYYFSMFERLELSTVYKLIQISGLSTGVFY